MSTAGGRVFAVDPGLRQAGLAFFDGGLLVGAEVVVHKNGDGPHQWLGMGAAVAAAIAEYAGRRRPTDELVIEYMQTRRGKTAAHDDLIQLSQVSGVIYALGGPPQLFHAPANTWTSGYTKEKNHPRIRRRLSADELATLDDALAGFPPGSWKEIMDAVGIGLWHLRRL
jgi:hypothetical protein